MAENLIRWSLGLWGFFVEQVQVDMCEKCQVNRTCWASPVKPWGGAREQIFKTQIWCLYYTSIFYQACQIWWVLGVCYITPICAQCSQIKRNNNNNNNTPNNFNRVLSDWMSVAWTRIKKNVLKVRAQGSTFFLFFCSREPQYITRASVITTSCLPAVWKFPSLVHVSADLTVEAKQQQHDEEEHSPEGGEGHHGHRLGVGDERQARTCRGRVGWGGGGESRQRGVGGRRH